MSKKLLGIVALMAALSLTVSAAYAGDMVIGAKGGINIANLTGDVEDTETRMGILAGGFFGTAINENFTVRGELLYAMKGAKETYSEMEGGITVDIEETVKLDYLDIPLLAVGTFPASETVGIEIFAGPVFSLLMSAEAEVEATGTFEGVSASASETVDIKDELKSFDFGAAAGGAGVSFMVGTVSIVLEGRATFGLTSIPDEGDADVKNIAFGFMGGIAIPLGATE